MRHVIKKLVVFFAFYLVLGLAKPVTNAWLVNCHGHDLCLNLQFNQLAKIKYLSLKKPYRLVLDLPNKQLVSKVNKNSCKHKNLCSTINIGIHGKNKRIVIQSKNPLQYKVQQYKIKKNNYLYKIRLFRVAVHPKTLNKKAQKITQQQAQQKAQKITQKKKSTKIVVVIDPGHGGKDPGAVGLHRVKEKDVVLSIAKKLYYLLNNNPHFKAYLTRSDDRYLTLRHRLFFARKHRANFFLAIHADAYLNKKARGVSVYALSERGASSESARWLADQENNSELMGGAKLNLNSRFLSKMLIDLQQEMTSAKSIKLGERILSNFKKVTHLHYAKVEQAAFVVLKSPDILSLLVETGFVSNKKEAFLLKNKSYQNKLAASLYQSIVSYYGKASDFKVVKPQKKWLIVKKGDTLYSISKNNGITVKALLNHNVINDNHIKIGQKIKLVF